MNFILRVVGKRVNLPVLNTVNQAKVSKSPFVFYDLINNYPIDRYFFTVNALHYICTLCGRRDINLIVARRSDLLQEYALSHGIENLHLHGSLVCDPAAHTDSKSSTGWIRIKQMVFPLMQLPGYW